MRRHLVRLGRRKRTPHAVFCRQMAVIGIAACVGVVALFAFDEAISRRATEEPAGVRAFLSYATDIGLVAWYLYPGLAVAAVLLLLDDGRGARRHRVRRHFLGFQAAFLAAAVGFAQLATQALKVLFGRARPELLDDHGDLAFSFVRFGNEFASFPSGHSTTMGAVAVTLAIWFPSVRWAILIAGAALALSRITVEAHYPSDVLAGFTIGVLVTLSLGRALAARHLLYRLPHAAALFPMRAGTIRR